MKASYMLPSGSYNLFLSEEDLLKLLDKGRLNFRMSRDIPCVTGRGVYNPETKDMDTLDKKEVFNDLRFFLDEPVADLEGGFWGVQFLSICLEKGEQK